MKRALMLCALLSLGILPQSSLNAGITPSQPATDRVFTSPAAVIDPIATKADFEAAIPNCADRAFALYTEALDFIQKPYAARLEAASAEFDKLSPVLAQLSALLKAQTNENAAKARVQESLDKIATATIKRYRIFCTPRTQEVSDRSFLALLLADLRDFCV